MKSIRNGFIRFLILFLVFFFQSSPIIDRFSIKGVTPDLLFTVLFIYAIYIKDSEVVTYALVFGSATDLLFGKIYGVSTVLLIGFICLCILLNKYIYTESRVIVGVYCGIVSFLYELSFLLINTAIWHKAVFSLEVFQMILIKSVYNGLVVLPGFYFARKIIRASQEVRL